MMQCAQELFGVPVDRITSVLLSDAQWHVVTAPRVFVADYTEAMEGGKYEESYMTWTSGTSARGMIAPLRLILGVQFNAEAAH